MNFAGGTNTWGHHGAQYRSWTQLSFLSLIYYFGWEPGLKFPENRKTEKAKQGDFGSALPKMPTGIKTFLDVKDVQDGNDKIVQRRARRKMKIVQIAKYAK